MTDTVAEVFTGAFKAVPVPALAVLPLRVVDTRPSATGAVGVVAAGR